MSEHLLHKAGKTGVQKLPGYGGEEDTLTKIRNALYKIHRTSILTRYSLYILPVASLLTIPLVSRFTIYEFRSHVSELKTTAGPYSNPIRGCDSERCTSPGLVHLD